ncbi:MAG: hypothetical protein KF693_00940 [Nitrospira sp.]|nr:hypothetical protein [Nitrospira sp.]
MAKNIVSKMIVLCVSGVLGILGCEALARVVLNPADFLSPRTVTDDVLGISIVPHSSGFDEWGFRNSKVPTAADVVTVGDSHTYGNTATMDDAWPSVVARATNMQVYNLGLGGYGPNQYHYLLMTKGLKLKPKWVICGIYMGDDFENAFMITYGLDHWASLRVGQWNKVNSDIWGIAAPPVWGADIRNWLSEHSMVYRLIFHSPLFAILKEAVRFEEILTKGDPYTTAVVIEDQNIREAFRPIGMAERLDKNSAPVREGMRITFHLLKEMDQACKQVGCKFLTAIIPTKETVFGEYITQNPQLHLRSELEQVIRNEQSVKIDLVDFLSREGIAFVDTLPALRRSIKDQLYAQTTRDMHPGKNGYRVIGETVVEYLLKHTSETRTYLKTVDGLNILHYKSGHAPPTRRSMGADTGTFSRRAPAGYPGGS